MKVVVRVEVLWPGPSMWSRQPENRAAGLAGGRPGPGQVVRAAGAWFAPWFVRRQAFAVRSGHSTGWRIRQAAIKRRETAMAKKQENGGKCRTKQIDTSVKSEKASLDFPSMAVAVVGTCDRVAEKLPPGLYVVSTPIGNLGDITLRALATLAAADVVACEDTRVTSRLLNAYGLRKPLLSYHEHNATARHPELMRIIAEGRAVALVSDAGTPVVSDPGYGLVSASRDAGYAVFAIPGANAMLAAIASCGLPSDRFMFVGFLPAKSAGRKKELEKLAGIGATLVFHETAPRLSAALADMAATLGGERQAAVARELTKLFEEVQRGTIDELARHYAEAPQPKGEILILVSSLPDREEKITDTAATARLLADSLKRMSLRDAVAEVAAITGAKRGEIYKMAISMIGDMSDI